MNTTTHKIITVGNSLAVTLPNDFVKKHRLSAGKTVTSDALVGEIRYSVKKSRYTKYEAIKDREFFELIKRVESRYGQALQELAKLP